MSNADSQDISVLELDRSQGVLKPVETVPVAGTVMPMVVSADKRFLYAALRSQPYRVVSFGIDAGNGHLRKLGESALADSMANIDLDATGRWLFAASYRGQKITVNSVGKDGVVGAVQQLIPTSSFAHAIHADAGNKYVLATSLGGDTVSSWYFDAATGQLTPNEPALTVNAPKSGARHFIWDKAQRFVYLVNEVDASLYVYAWDSARGTLRELPSTGLLQPLGQTPTEQSPRGFAIDSSGRFLISAGQDSNSVSVHPVDAASGALGWSQRLVVGKNPNWIEIVDLP